MEPPQVPLAGRVIGFVFGFVFFGVGCAVPIFLWSQPFGGFGSPPLFFRVIGTLISLAFLAIGGGTCYAAITGRHAAGRLLSRMARHGGGAPGAGRRYECPQCGAPLAEGADVSPSGDVRCGHCNAWYNIHRGGP